MENVAAPLITTYSSGSPFSAWSCGLITRSPAPPRQALTPNVLMSKWCRTGAQYGHCSATMSSRFAMRYPVITGVNLTQVMGSLEEVRDYVNHGPATVEREAIRTL